MANNLLIDLDSILDTRLPILYSIDKDLTEQILKDNSYKTRVTNSFNYISSTVFKELYKLRNKQVLATPIPTPITDLITEYTLETKTLLIDSKSDDELVVYVNIYPYNLNKKEIEIVTTRFKEMLPSFSKVEVINRRVQDISIDFLIDNINVFIHYSGIEWFKYHMDVGELSKRNLPNVMLIVPKLLDYTIPKNKAEEYFKEMKESSKVFIDLNFLPVKYFSLM